MSDSSLSFPSLPHLLVRDSLCDTRTAYSAVRGTMYLPTSSRRPIEIKNIRSYCISDLFPAPSFDL